MPSTSHFYIHRQYEVWDTILPNDWTDGTAILSTSEEDEDNEYIDAHDCNKLVLYFDVTLGSATLIEVKIFFSDDTATWHQRTSEALVGGVNTLAVYYESMAAAGQYRLPITIMDRYIKVQVRATGNVAGSSLTAKAFVGTA